MAKYLDETGLRTLWTKIKGTFVAQTIKKSDSSNATQIAHNGEAVILSNGTMIHDDTAPGGTKYLRKTSISIKGDDIHFIADHRPAYKASTDENFTNFVISSDIATSSTAGLVKSTATGKTANRDYMVEVNPDGTMKVNVPWTDNNTTYTIATSSTPGLVKLGSDTVQSTAANSVTSTSSRTYAVQKNGNNQLVVNVPWTDTNTTYTFNGAVSTIKDNNLTPSKVLISNSDGKVAVSNISSKELSYLEGANENIQNRLNLLTSYFNADGNALYAMADEDGHNIVNTYATKTELNDFKGLKGQKNGLAELDSNGKVPSSQLPSYVDDVIEGYYYNSKFYKEESHTNEIAGESGKIYTDLGNNKTYRWSGTTYTEISASLALGTTSSTAYPGNLGAANATNIGHLQGYFDNGKAIYAINDASGNVITDTYAKKSALSIYATKTELNAKANLSNGNNFIGNQSITGNLDILTSSGAGKITIKGDSSHHPGGVILQTTATSSTTANTITIPAKTGTMALTSDIKTYSAGNGISLNGTTFSLNTSYENNGRNYAVLVDSNKNLYVNVPWVNTTDHSHSNKSILDAFEGAIPDSAINALS